MYACGSRSLHNNYYSYTMFLESTVYFVHQSIESFAIREHNSLIVDTISTDLNYFSQKFVEKGFITRDTNSDIRGMYGVGEREKASRLLDSALNSLKISKEKSKWFHEFLSIFSVKPAYRDLAERMMETLSGTSPNRKLKD